MVGKGKVVEIRAKNVQPVVLVESRTDPFLCPEEPPLLVIEVDYPDRHERWEGYNITHENAQLFYNNWENIVSRDARKTINKQTVLLVETRYINR